MSKYSVNVDVDVDLDEFDEDDIVEYLQEQGYKVVKEDDGDLDKGDDTYWLFSSSSYEGMMSSIRSVKRLLQDRQYDSSFLRLMLSEIADMPMGSSVDAVMEKLKTMC